MIGGRCDDNADHDLSDHGGGTVVIVNELQATIRTQAPSGRLLVAFSGGRDSTVLLHGLVRALPEREIVALHVNHGLHPRAGEWAEHCRQAAKDLGVGFRGLTATVRAGAGESLEAVARTARYGALAGEVAAGDTLLTAHHAGDQLETLIQRLVRGAGRRGFSGIRSERTFSAGQLLRPLLAVEEAGIQAYAEAHGLVWLEDPSNRNERFDRNYIRHRIMPLLRARWPAADRQAARSAGNLAVEAALLQEIGEADLGGIEDDGRLRLSRLARLSPRRQGNALRCWLAKHLGHVPDADALTRLEQEVIGARADANPALRIGEHALRRHGDWLYLTSAGIPPALPGPCYWTAPALSIRLPGNGRLCLEGVEKGERVGLPDAVTVRYRRAGDYFHDGRHHRKLKEWLRLAGIPPEDRERTPLLLDGEIIFAVGDTVVDPRYIAVDTVQKASRTGKLRWYRDGQDGIPD